MSPSTTPAPLGTLQARGFSFTEPGAHLSPWVTTSSQTAVLCVSAVSTQPGTLCHYLCLSSVPETGCSREGGPCTLGSFLGAENGAPHQGNVCFCKDDNRPAAHPHEEEWHLPSYVSLHHKKVLFSFQSALSTTDLQVGLEKTRPLVFSTRYPHEQKAMWEADQKNGSCFKILTFVGMLALLFSSPNSEQIWLAHGRWRGQES